MAFPLIVWRQAETLAAFSLSELMAYVDIVCLYERMDWIWIPKKARRGGMLHSSYYQVIKNESTHRFHANNREACAKGW